MRRKTRVLLIVCCLSLFGLFALGSGSSSNTEEDKDISSVNTDATESADTQAEAGTDNVTTSDTGVSIEEQVLYEENGIKITATGLEDSFLGTDLKLLIENDSDKNIIVQAKNANVNGYMVDTMMSAEVASGKKANDGLTFQTSGLKECGIEQMATLEFQFHIFDADSWEEIVDTDVIKIDTSVAEGYEQKYDDSGEVLVDTNGIKIVGKGLSANDSFWGPGVILYIENNSDQDVTIQVRDVSVNGYMVSSSMSEDVVASKKAISAVQFFSTDLEDNGIEDITDVELYFSIVNLDTWDSIFDSDVIKITF